MYSYNIIMNELFLLTKYVVILCVLVFIILMLH